MRRKAVLYILLLLAAANTIYGGQCGDRGNNKRGLVYVQQGQEQNEYAPVLKLLPGCHFSWQEHVGTYRFCKNCNNDDPDILLFDEVALPWGQAAVLHHDTDLVFSHEVHGKTVITILRMRRRWSLCPLWPVCS